MATTTRKEVTEGCALCIGNPLLDMSVTVDTDELLQKYELKPSNSILAEDKHLPLYGEIEKNKTIEYIAGGAGQNTIRVAQWMLGVPRACSYLGSVGKDENGRRLKEACTADGVNAHYHLAEDKPTGTCAVIIYNQDRSMVANLAAANHYVIDHFRQADSQALVASARTVYMSSFFLTVSVETAQELAEKCNADGKTFMLNLAAPFLMEVPFFFDRVKTMLGRADFVFANEHEAAALGKAMGWGEEVPAIARKLQQLPKTGGAARTVIFTQGSAPAIVVTADGATAEFPPTLIPKDQIVDLNGAGDAFCGGFVAAHTLGLPLAECMKAAHYAASRIIRVSGTNTKLLGRCDYFDAKTQ